MFENKDFTILIPCYKDLDTLRLLLAEIDFLNPSEVVVIDCNSKENLREVTKNYDNVTLLNYPKKNAKHKALEVGFSYCMNLDTKYILTIDAKKYHSIKEIIDIMALMNTGKYSLISGNKKILSFKDRVKLFFPKILIALLTDIHNKDVFSDLRAYKKGTLRRMMYSRSSFHLSLKVSRDIKEKKGKAGFLSYGQDIQEKKVFAKKKRFRFFLKFLFRFTKEWFFKFTGVLKRFFLFLKIFVKKFLKNLAKKTKYYYLVFLVKCASFFLKRASSLDNQEKEFELEKLKKRLEDLKRIYGVPDVKKLNQKQQAFYLFSILFPLLMVYSVLHLYALPFGYYEEFGMDDLTISQDYFYTIDGVEVLDGIAEVTVNPRINRANVFADIKIEGDDDLYIIPEKIEEGDLKDDVWDKEWVFEEDFDYLLLDDYEVKKDSDYLTFKIEIELDKNEKIEHPQVIMKYQGLMLIRHQDVIEWRKMEVSSRVHRMFYHLQDDDFKKPISVLLINKSIDASRNSHGVYFFYVNNKLIEAPVNNYQKKRIDGNEMTETVPIIHYWGWNKEFLTDVSQKYISIKQEEYTNNLIKEMNSHKPNREKLEIYYKKTFKDPNPDIGFRFGEESTCNYYDLNNIYNQTCQLLEKRTFKYKDKNEQILEESQQSYYVKAFLNNFDGRVNQLSIKYTNPFKKSTRLTNFYNNTNSKIKIAGENSRLNKLGYMLHSL